MTNKIILTKEQYERIRLESKNGDVEYKELTLDCHLAGWGDKKNQCLRSLSISEMARVLYEPNSYEIEQIKFEVGDIVKSIAFGDIFKITSVDYKGIVGEATYLLSVDKESIGKTTQLSLEAKFFVHATKEEAFWAELGRKVGEFKDNDVVKETSSISPYKLKSVQDLKNAKFDYEKKYLKGFYPAESFIKFPTGNE